MSVSFYLNAGSVRAGATPAHHPKRASPGTLSALYKYLLNVREVLTSEGLVLTVAFDPTSELSHSACSVLVVGLGVRKCLPGSVSIGNQDPTAVNYSA